MSEPLAATRRAEVVRAIKAAGVVAVIRTSTADEAFGTARACIAGGLRVIEITLTVPDAVQVIRALASEFQGEEVLIGAGTVLTAGQATEAADARAEFLVSPCVLPAVMNVARARGLAMLPGAFTPTEIYTAYSAGADIVKIFPAGQLGPSYFKDLKGPLPQVPLMPTSGVKASNVADWFRAGAVAVGAGSSVLDPALIKNGDWAALTERAREFVDLVQTSRSQA